MQRRMTLQFLLLLIYGSVFVCPSSVTAQNACGMKEAYSREGEGQAVFPIIEAVRFAHGSVDAC
jgi:hypothetical protein